MENVEIRESGPGDLSAIEMLYRSAFPDEDLLPVVGELLQETAVRHSLVGVAGSAVVAHGMFTTCAVTGCSDVVALLAPLAVAPALQRQGIGRAIVDAGLGRLKNAGMTGVYVLGDPAYYGRLGFGSETDVAPPYPLPAEWRGAWQSIGLGGKRPSRGTLTVPKPWRQPALWGP